MKKFKVCVLAVVATCVVLSCGSDYESRLTVQGWDEGLKLGLGSHNPLIDFQFTADPTAVEYEGRLYVYGTNDQQQFEQAERNLQFHAPQDLKALLTFAFCQKVPI